MGSQSGPPWAARRKRAMTVAPTVMRPLSGADAGANRSWPHRSLRAARDFSRVKSGLRQVEVDHGQAQLFHGQVETKSAALKESAEERRRFIRNADDLVRCLTIEFEIELG